LQAVEKCNTNQQKRTKAEKKEERAEEKKKEMCIEQQNQPTPFSSKGKEER